MFKYSSLYLYTSVLRFLSICGFYPLHALSLSLSLSLFLFLLLSYFLCLYLPISFFLSLLCSSSLFSKYFFVNLVSASKSVYHSVFHFNYIHCSSFIFLCVGRNDCVSISIDSVCFFSLLYGRYFGTKK